MSLDALNEALGYRARRITRYVSLPAQDASLDDISIVVTRLAQTDIDEMMQQLEALPYVHDVAKPSI